MKNIYCRSLLLGTLGSLQLFQLSGMNYYVSLQGKDDQAGTIEMPFRTLEKGIGLAVPGDTVFVRSGTYPTTETVRIQKSGTAESYCTLMAYPGERALLDCSGQAQGTRGMTLSGSYWTIAGFDIFGAGDNGLMIAGGNRNRILNCAFIGNRDSGRIPSVRKGRSSIFPTW